MAAINFGYTISKPRAIDIDRNNLRKSDEILREMPELQACIGCGACAQVCPQHIDIPAALADLTKIIAEGPDWAKVSAERLKRDRK